MKLRYYIPLLIVFNVVFGVCVAYSQTAWYLSCNANGNNANGGTSWSDAKLTWANLEPSVTANDTVFGAGTCNEDLLLASVFDVVYMDSTLNIFGVNNMIFKTDTTKLWYDKGWKFDNGAIRTLDLTGEHLADSSKFYGISFTGNAATPHFLDGGNSHSLEFWLCRFSEDGGDHTSNPLVQIDDIQDMQFRYCLFANDGTLRSMLFYGDQTSNADVQYCTFFGSVNSKIFRINSPEVSAWQSDTLKIKNNIFIDNSVVAGTWLVNAHTTSFSGLMEFLKGSWDYNVYYAVNQAEEFNWNAVFVQNETFSQWRDSLQTGTFFIDANAEINSFSGIDPLLGSMDIATGTFFLKNNSFVRGKASDGTNIGYYQTGSDDTRRRGLKRSKGAK